jgi:hypothetical protein
LTARQKRENSEIIEFHGDFEHDFGMCDKKFGWWEKNEARP